MRARSISVIGPETRCAMHGARSAVRDAGCAGRDVRGAGCGPRGAGRNCAAHCARIRRIPQCCPRRLQGCSARQATSTSTPGAGRARADHPRAWRSRAAGQRRLPLRRALRTPAAAAVRRRTTDRDASLRRNAGPGTRTGQLPSRRTRARLGTDPGRGAGRRLGGRGGLQARRRPDLHAVRATPLRHLRRANPRSACRSTAGIRRRRSSTMSSTGGARTARPGARRSSSATPSARRSGFSPSSRR